MQVSYELLSASNLDQVQRLNYAVLQANYSSSFYKTQLKTPELSRVGTSVDKTALFNN